MKSIIIALSLIGLIVNAVGAFEIESEAVKTKFPHAADLTAGKYIEHSQPLTINAISASFTLWTRYPMIVNLYRKHHGDIQVRLHFDRCNGANMCVIRLDGSSCDVDIIVEVIDPSNSSSATYYAKIHYAECFTICQYMFLGFCVITTILVITCVIGGERNNARRSDEPRDDSRDPRDDISNTNGEKETTYNIVPENYPADLTSSVMKHSYVQMEPAQIV